MNDYVIKAIDGLPVGDAKSLYHLLSDDRTHRLLVLTPGGQEEIQFHVEPAELVGFSFVDLDRLFKASAVGRDERWGFTNPRSVFYGEGEQWAMPGDLFGTPHVILDIPRDPYLSRMFIAALSAVERPRLPMFVVRPVDNVEPDIQAWSDEERASLAAISRVSVVTTPWDSRKASSEPWGSFFYGLMAPPNIFVVDCHGVVRWHAGGWILSDPTTYQARITEAFEFSSELTAEVTEGQCWRAIAPGE